MSPSESVPVLVPTAPPTDRFSATVNVDALMLGAVFVVVDSEFGAVTDHEEKWSTVATILSLSLSTVTDFAKSHAPLLAE